MGGGGPREIPPGYVNILLLIFVYIFVLSPHSFPSMSDCNNYENRNENDIINYLVSDKS